MTIKDDVICIIIERMHELFQIYSRDEITYQEYESRTEELFYLYKQLEIRKERG